MKSLVLIGGLCGALSMGGFAAPAAADTAYDKCVAASGGVIPAIKACGAQQSQSNDGRLNQSYARVLRSTSARNQAGLRAAERAWIAFRDAECGFRYASEGGGQDASLVASQCRMELTSDRIRQLDAYARPPR